MDLHFYGDGVLPLEERYTLRAGKTLSLRVDPGASGLRSAGVAGVVVGAAAAVAGGLLLAYDTAVQPSDPLLDPGADAAILGGGLVLAGLGVWGTRASRTHVTVVEAVPAAGTPQP